MKTFQKTGVRQKSSLSITTFPGLARPSRPFAPVPMPASEQVPRMPEAQLHRVAPVGYSIATLPLFPSIVPASPQVPVQRSLSLEGENTHAIQLSGAFPLQQKMSTKDSSVEGISQEGKPLQRASAPIQNRENKTGLPDALKAGIENLSGISMDDVNVRYNSAKPAQVLALAYTQGTDIHIGPGQEMYLPHEAWHVVQQMQRRVRPTIQMRGTAINDDQELEREADTMGIKAVGVQKPALVASPDILPMFDQQRSTGHTRSSTVYSSYLLRPPAVPGYSPIQGVFTLHNRLMSLEFIGNLEKELRKIGISEDDNSEYRSIAVGKREAEKVDLGVWLMEHTRFAYERGDFDQLLAEARPEGRSEGEVESEGEMEEKVEEEPEVKTEEESEEEPLIDKRKASLISSDGGEGESAFPGPRPLKKLKSKTLKAETTYTEYDIPGPRKPFWTKQAGYKFEEQQEANIGGTEPVIDSVQNGRAISLKTFDLFRNYVHIEDNKKYLNSPAFKEKLRKYLRDLYNWPEHITPEKVDLSEIKSKVLIIGIPVLTVWPKVRAAIHESIRSLSNKFVESNKKHIERLKKMEKEKRRRYKMTRPMVPMDPVEIVEKSSLFSEVAPGYKYEKWESAQIGGMPPGNTPIIDDWDPDSGTAKSLKTFNLAKYYRGAGGVKEFKDKWGKYVSRIISFGEKGGKIPGGKLDPSAIFKVILKVAIPPKEMIKAQNKNADQILSFISSRQTVQTLKRKDGSSFKFSIEVTHFGSASEYRGPWEDI